ncbi:MAG TPA: BREX-1 system adenine-specific DNA-methyltransferase PglX, partial [Alphaproteobacteria bacterium]|nr:BREX-1 system adenine-specific DNA-methyltransferase PglX [Alphaproteobacteria bacterium]
QCARLAREVRVLFDPDNLASRLCPRPQALRALIDLLNDDQLQEAWQPGNEETIGWVYQFFIEQQKKDVFDRLYKKKEKIRAEDIPAATEIFTPRWVVRCLVENTLGRMWVQMHPDSRLAQQLVYLVPQADPLPQVPLKHVREIRVLDPACGTMHFGLVAFDLLVEMYREEIERAGQHGWPQKPSVEAEADIPATILADNLHGIDIDLRAVQLSALTLYLRAKTLNPNAMLSESRLACADILMLDGDRLTQFLEQAGLDKRPIYGRILSALQQRLKHANQLGSLLRLDEEIRKLIEEERSRYERLGRQPDLFGWPKEQFETEAGRREFWEILEIQIGQALDAFARERAAEGVDQGFFATEATKGLRLLEITGQRYDVVLTNPPYMTGRNMNAVLKEYLQKEYPVAKSDLYAAFVQRCTEWLADGGRLGMITQQSFMFISSYEKLREFLRQRIAIETMPHVGPRAFQEVTGEKVNTTLLVFRREPNAQTRNNSVGTYFRLVKESDGKAKQARFEQALANLSAGQPDPIVYRYRQGDFDAIPGSPWVYWITTGVKRIFETSKPLEGIAEPRQGLATADNRRFLRYWWEVGTQRIAFRCQSREESDLRREKWYPYMKGGSFKRWYGNQEYVINYGLNGFELKAWADPLYGNSGWSRIIKSTEYYFRRGVTWTDLTSGRFSARLSPGGFIFDVKGSSAFPDDIPLVLALLNSSFAHYALNLLNPTVSFQVGDLARLPIPNSSNLKLSTLVGQAIDLAKADSQEDETTYDFISLPAWETGLDDIAARHCRLAEIEQEIDDAVYRLYGISGEDRAAIEAELAEPTAQDASDEENGDFGSDTEDIEAAEEAPLTREELARRWISYAVGIVMGRFQPGIDGALGRGHFSEDIAAQLRALADSDGILVLDQGHPDDLATKVLQALQVMLGINATAEVIAEGMGRRGNPEEELRRYFERTFYKEHIQQYRKRPVYWLLQSPRRTYSVWLFHEKLTKDTLYRIRGEQYVASKIRLLESCIADLHRQREAAQGRERRALEKQVAELTDMLDDLRAFAERIDAILQRGYTPHIDDGVLINMAPLWELMPSWQAEPKKCWEALARGDYDWSHQAMDHWPERVRKKCQTNKSYAIAHGLA